jgi:hypothetical protein
MDKIQTLHPDPNKKGRSIDKDKYNTLKATILEILKDREPTHNELFEEIDRRLKGKFDGNAGWYGETLKLDLEARKIIERTKDRPAKYRIK